MEWYESRLRGTFAGSRSSAQRRSAHLDSGNQRVSLKTSSTLERRLAVEWDTLRALATQNEGRLVALSAQDLEVRFVLRDTPALTLDQPDQSSPIMTTEHQIRIVFPFFFPTAPMEMYLRTPMLHPNIHPETGFVCLWNRHQVANTVEHAVHKLVAMLGWRLWNADPVHVMQPDALVRMQAQGAAVDALLTSPPLQGLLTKREDVPEPPRTMRRRLS